MTPPDPLADLLTLARYAALGCAHSGTVDDLAVVASAALRVRQALAPAPPDPLADPVQPPRRP